MRSCMMLLWALFTLLTVDAQEIRIPAYVNRGQNRPVVRVIPSDSVVIRVRKPDQPKVVSILKDSSMTRIQPILVKPAAPPRISLLRVLSEMGLLKMASLIDSTQLQTYLHERGPATLFAPTDEAFSLMSTPRDQKRLRDFVLQHVVQGRIAPQDIRNDVTLPSMRSGSTPLRFNVYEDGQMLSVSGSQFLDDARDAGNVRIQPVDRVLYPISNEDMVKELKLTFPRMHELLMNSSLTPKLRSGTFTLFVPTDEAFNVLAPHLQQKLTQNATLLAKVLMNHIVPGTHYSAVLAHGYALRSLGGEPIHFTNRRGLILANGVPVVKADISVNNGVIHAVNRFLLPPELHLRRRPATMAPPPMTSPAPGPALINEYTPVLTYIEPPPSTPRTLSKTITTPLELPDGRKMTFSTANSLYRRSLLLSTLKKNGTNVGYTILVPSDEAFRSVGQEALDRLRRNSRLLRRMLLCQMFEGRLNFSSNDQKDRPIRSLGGTIIISSLDGGKSLMAGGARVLSIRQAADGLVLVTDRVTFPPASRNVADAIAPFSMFKNVLQQQPKIDESLKTEGSVYTIFAPTDAALASLTQQQLQDRNFMSELFWSHVVPGAYYRSRLAPGLRLTTIRGNPILIHRAPTGDLFVNEKPVSGKEILAGNGVIHPIDSLLFIPVSKVLPSAAPVDEEDSDLTKIAQEFNATQFLQWMSKAHMKNLLRTQVSRTGGCTLFLPTDTSLNGMSPTLRSATLGDPERLKKFIRFHISPQVLSWNSVHDNALMPSLLPRRNIRCNIYARGTLPGVLTVSGCRVSAVRPLPEDRNITVAVIEGTMAPPVGNIALVAAKSPMLSNFSKVLKVAGGDQFLTDGGPYTLFAPNACVFKEMDPDEYHRLISNSKLARDFVRRHMVKDCFYSSGLQDGQVLVTVAGTKLEVQVTPECILISGVKLLFGDMGATNGVLHVVASSLPQ